MFLITNIQESTVHTKFEGMFMIYPHKKFYMLSSNGSLVITVKL